MFLIISSLAKANTTAEGNTTSEANITAEGNITSGANTTRRKANKTTTAIPLYLL